MPLRKLNIAVVGAGPAGLAVALLLARDGHKATIFERFDAPKPIGSGPFACFGRWDILKPSEKEVGRKG